MENATKALLIAAAILIAIILISLGITVIRQGQEKVSEAGSALNTAEAEQFNGKFVGYEGSHKSTSQVRALLREIVSHNIQEAASGTNRFVSVGGSVTLTTGATSVPTVTGNSYYTITLNYDSTTGLVTSITIS